MKLELRDKRRSTVLQDSAGQPEMGAVARGPWHCPQLTIIDVKRTMAGLGVYTDGGTGSSF